MIYALVRLATNEIVREQSDIDPNAGTKAGLKWLPIVESRTGPGSILVSVVNTVEAVRVSRVLTFRDKTAAEIDAEKDALVASEVDFALGRVMFQITNGLLRAINDDRVARGQAILTLPQFQAYLTDTRPAGQTITAAQFRSFVKGLLP